MKNQKIAHRALGNKILHKSQNKAMKDMNIEECKFLNYCSGNGKCEDGKCICDPGWMNYDCSISKYINLNIMSLY